ncbi:MAG: hypothetical protein M3P06_02700 [Acidobacteriota bacterium]|nr:hypothetical protein [Acidobacteriota bacterium]
MNPNRPADFDGWLSAFTQRLAIISVELLLLFGIIIVAAAVALVVRAIVPRLLTLLRFDRLAARIGLTGTLHRSALDASPSQYVGRFLAWTTLFLVFVAGSASLNLPWTQRIVDRGLLFVPAFVSAVIIVIAGALFAEFIARGILIAAVNAGWRAAAIVSAIARVLVLLLAGAMALEQIGVAPVVVAATFSILLGGVVLAVALAFGLGGRDLAADYLRKKFGDKPKREPGSELDHV